MWQKGQANLATRAVRKKKQAREQKSQEKKSQDVSNLKCDFPRERGEKGGED